ncbi:MAG: hypothetical protein A2920_01810 [Candidatus Zambryskibacteria bacterium RIFCSPLOWO2_01_FULL_43_17]|uniref:Uncharacterized protein n=1 Tax=Candidatus Zambryskibacteria bacterium RIFCSPLOWO2_01_FULL_43_17 TaxID=1802760 RepID=A0A1G2U3Q6_9BACT|nr:MAG: hypothetical protein A2920_01810 [Candidatus Zambryskibacteria bacterium RIFCSPLOWO2_01_FULL_43_17]
MAVEENRGKLKCKIQKEFKGFSNKGKRNFFKTIPIMKSSNWLARSHFALRATRDKYAGSPAIFRGNFKPFCLPAEASAQAGIQ